MELLQRIKKALQSANTGDQDTGQQKDLITGDLSSEIIDSGCSSYLVSAAARICVGRKPVEEYEDRVKHIGRVVGRGHESTLEHTNIIMMLHFSDSVLEYFTKLASSMFYLHWHIHQDIITKEYHVLIGGSIRGYKNVFRLTKENSSNPVYEEIKNDLASSAESIFFEDFFEDGIMNKNDFAYMNDEIPEIKTGERVDIIDAHAKFIDVFEKVHQYGFNEKEVMDVCALTVIFHDISRPISMQIVRHRNGISQESQRYVDYSTKSFIDPIQFTKDESNKDKMYTVEIFGLNKLISPKDLGDELMKVYHQLTQQGMLKQDARGFLPSNVCTRLMMTFTYASFFHFLVMRQDKAAQPEIQEIANEANDMFASYDVEASLHIGNDKLKEFAEKPEYYFIRKREEEKISTLDEIIEEDTSND